MKRWVLLFTLCAVPASAQTEIRGGAGLSDAALYTHGPRAARFSVGVEWRAPWWGLRTGVAFTKEGTYPMDGYGLETTVGRRVSWPPHLTGTIRLGASLTMQSAPYGSFSFTDGTERSWTRRHILLNGPLDSTSLIPFAEFGVQRPVVGRLFCEARLRISVMWTESERATGTVGAMDARADRSRTPVPGYSVGIGYRF